MNRSINRIIAAALGLALCGAASASAPVGPSVYRLTPPSHQFPVPGFLGGTGGSVARFLPGQRFDLQATVKANGATLTSFVFKVDGAVVPGTVSTTAPTASGFAAGDKIATLRAYSNTVPGPHTLTIEATDSTGAVTKADTSFEVVAVTQSGRKVKNIVLMIGDGMGIAHRTAARLVQHGVHMGKANSLLNMDTFPFTGIVMTPSLNSIVTDSAPGAACYSTGNKCYNGQEGVFPDDTTDTFDNPRVENVGEYLHRTKGASLGLVTTADVFDATPAAIAVHTSNRGNGTGICDQYLQEAPNTGLQVLLGGGRKWFLPAKTNGVTQATSARKTSSDYALPAELATGWGVANNVINANRDLIGDFVSAGWTYVADNTSLSSVVPAPGKKLLGLFSYSNMNVAKDKIDGRRGVNGPNGQPVVNDYLLPDQPLLEEMTSKALEVLATNPNGFFLMVEGASIDKQAHLMDTERWITDTIEFDNAVGVAKQFAQRHEDTLVIVTADHECGGINIIGASQYTAANLAAKVNNPSAATALQITNGVTGVAVNTTGYAFTPNADLRDKVVGTYDAAGFPVYSYGGDGYPTTLDVDGKIVIGYAGNADRFETYSTYPTPTQDSQQPLINLSPLNGYPLTPAARNITNGVFITGQVPGASGGYQAVHTASDIPVSAFGRGASKFTGVMENTDVFFKAMQAALGGATNP